MNREDVAKQKDDEIKRKIFLGGLNKDTKESTIEAYFSKWGEIEDILINRNIGDNSSKRCAFLLFKSHIVAQELIQSRVVHIIEGNKVEVKQCYDKSVSKNLKQEKVNQNNGLQEQDFMNMVSNDSYGANMGFIMNNFMQSFVSNFSPFDQAQAQIYNQDLINNQGFKEFLNVSHSNLMMDFSTKYNNNLITPLLPYQNCPIYNMSNIQENTPQPNHKPM